jgi:Protein of unknown function (DUF429)
MSKEETIMENSRKSVFVGIDVAFAKKKRLPICVCSIEGGTLTPLDLRWSFEKPPAGKGNKAALSEHERLSFATKVLEWLSALESKLSLKIERIAIDAPMDYAQGKRRASECEMDMRKISCFATPSLQDFDRKIDEAKCHLDQGGEEAKMPNANQLWMLVGFALFRALEQEYECIEVFPQAIVREIGCGQGHKSTSVGLDEQIKQFAKVISQSETTIRKSLKNMGFGSDHDRLDAFLSAWVASLPQESRIACGVPSHDAIWIPDVSKLKAVEEI